MKIGAIILAAGASTRMGTSKQMLQVNGERLLTRTIKAVTRASIDHIVVVLGAGDVLHRTIISINQVDVVTNERWHTGIGSSIRKGLQSLTTQCAELDAAIILVCDQPMLSSEIVAGIISAFHATSKPIVASGYSDSAGVPALFARSYFDKLNQLPDDAGAKKVILQNAADVVVVPFPGGEIDLDTMEDYRRFMETGNQ